MASSLINSLFTQSVYLGGRPCLCRLTVVMSPKFSDDSFKYVQLFCYVPGGDY